jgi:hypothetical protein
MQNEKLTICLSYYNQKEPLRRIVRDWKNYSDEVRRSFVFSIVDDCSYWRTALEVLDGIDLSDLNLHIYRVKEDLYCNISGVRNLAARECNTEWMMILDMDTLITKEVSEQILAIINTPRELSKDAYRFNRLRHDEKGASYEKPHPACCLIRTRDYWKAGGCNEDLVGKYGGTDANFWGGWRKAGLEVFTFKDIYLEHYEDGEAPQVDRNVNRQRVHPHIPSPPKYVRFPWEKIYP